MTNPTLERAARALCDATGADWGAISPTRRQYVVTATRAVLMAVLPDEVDADGAPDWMDPAQAYGWGCGFNACRQAILNDGEGE